MLTYDQDGFRRAGRPHRIVSGALHYFRVHPELWEDRLTRLRALGANTVDTYVPWNFHETAPGKADFTGWRDLGRFLRLAQDLGLDAVVRPGHQQLFEWEIRPLPLTGPTGLDRLDWSGNRAAARPAGRPGFHRFTHALADGHGPADAFLDLSGWGTGLVWLNGFLLGHYDTPRGPQRTLYAPGPLWCDGENEIVVLELERPGTELPLRDRPDLGRTTVVTLR
ncbi:beta-galactosidase [Streptomyces sp. NBC_01233]|uniref:beta-galactosidase n=1 Tax=Streptomyces sp. NBC_01233 TaxID=2903787 RepID=UPI003FA38562